MKKLSYIWGGVDLPAWDLDAFHSAFLRARATKSQIDIDKLSRYLMVLIALRICTKRWLGIFQMNGVDPAEAGCMVLSGMGPNAKGLYQKALLMKLRSEAVPHVLIAAINRTIERDLVSVWRKHNRKTAVRTVNEPIEIDRPETRFAAASVEKLAKALRSAKPAICGMCPESNRIFPEMVKGIIRGDHLPTFDQITRTFRGTIPNDVHTSIVFRLNRFVAEFAQDLSARAL